MPTNPKSLNPQEAPNCNLIMVQPNIEQLILSAHYPTDLSMCDQHCSLYSDASMYVISVHGLIDSGLKVLYNLK